MPDFLGWFRSRRREKAKREQRDRLILRVIRDLGDDAYGYTIRRALEEAQGALEAIGSLYADLERLEECGLVHSWDEPGGPERCRRDKKCFDLTAKGLERLEPEKTEREPVSVATDDENLKAVLQQTLADEVKQAVSALPVPEIARRIYGDGDGELPWQARLLSDEPVTPDDIRTALAVRADLDAQKAGFE